MDPMNSITQHCNWMKSIEWGAGTYFTPGPEIQGHHSGHLGGVKAVNTF
jgi:hypothetical protein